MTRRFGIVLLAVLAMRLDADVQLLSGRILIVQVRPTAQHAWLGNELHLRLLRPRPHCLEEHSPRLRQSQFAVAELVQFELQKRDGIRVRSSHGSEVSCRDEASHQCAQARARVRIEAVHWPAIAT